MSCNVPVSLPCALSGVGGCLLEGGPHTCSRPLGALHIREQPKQWGLGLWALILRGGNENGVSRGRSPPGLLPHRLFHATCLFPAVMKTAVSASIYYPFCFLFPQPP